MRGTPFLIGLMILAGCQCDEAKLKAAGLAIDVSPAEVDFGTQHVESTTVLLTQVHVSGHGIVQLESARLVGQDPAFSFEFEPVELQAPALLALQLTYRPLLPSESTDTLEITTDSPTTPTLTVALHGKAIIDCVDADGDGAGSGTQCQLGPDCDDTNAAVHPGATEVCGNGLDDDCDPATTDVCPCSIDLDGDTYVEGTDCERSDCDDGNAAVHPDATEICGNGLDDDCDPTTSDECPCLDKDGDGYGVGCRLGSDCDDERASVHPGATEVCGNGLDDDCDPNTSDDCPVVICPNGCGPGCSDGQREAFTDLTRYPGIAGCAGGWSVPGIAREDPPQCNRVAGDNSTNTRGTGCGVADLCATGWHVCRTAHEVATRSVDGCAGATTAGSFFATRQSGNGCKQCSVSSNPADLCDGNTCLASCYPDSSQTNDVFGCGAIGGNGLAASCAPFDRFSNNDCSSLPSPWSCSGGTTEAANIAKSGPGAGGVLCCAD